MFSLKPDYETTKKRYDAFWERDIIDRPPVNLPLLVEWPTAVPHRNYRSEWDRWTDVDFRAEQAAISLRNTEFYGDALPVAWPNMGPEIFSAWCGCPYHFGETTAWSEPCIIDWDEDADRAVFDPEHPLFKLTVRFTERLIELGRGNFIVGLTDFHPGGDHLAALRDPQNLAIDMVENVGHIKKLLDRSATEYFQAYDLFYRMLRKEEMPITSWTPLIHDGRYYIPSNDFSCMISTSMFEDVFLPGILDECAFYERSIYHLDGPGALRHLDTILSIADLDAVQWVPGAGNESFPRWVKVYQRIQRAGKGIQLFGLDVSDLPLLFESLKPNGIWISHISGVRDRETVDEVLRRVSAWE